MLTAIAAKAITGRITLWIISPLLKDYTDTTGGIVVNDASITPKRLSELLGESVRQATRDRIGAVGDFDFPLKAHR